MATVVPFPTLEDTFRLDAAALIPDSDSDGAVFEQLYVYVNHPQILSVGVDNTVGHRLADSGFNIRQLVNGRINLGHESRHGGPGKALVR